MNRSLVRLQMNWLTEMCAVLNLCHCVFKERDCRLRRPISSGISINSFVARVQMHSRCCPSQVPDTCVARHFLRPVSIIVFLLHRRCENMQDIQSPPAGSCLCSFFSWYYFHFTNSAGIIRNVFWGYFQIFAVLPRCSRANHHTPCVRDGKGTCKRTYNYTVIFLINLFFAVFVCGKDSHGQRYHNTAKF